MRDDRADSPVFGADRRTGVFLTPGGRAEFSDLLALHDQLLKSLNPGDSRLYTIRRSLINLYEKRGKPEAAGSLPSGGGRNGNRGSGDKGVVAAAGASRRFAYEQRSRPCNTASRS